ncbi:hypothetical protein JFU49_06010 [Pseudomonas sp. TH03]|uniref:hypothetical protein n=1 Tax=Pseudomonas sp. TH03 TaxID=2796369 RepID=UPI00191133F0|nr:hypothetical protein [Pseudomonas sp. TH03]MBK5549840.1 hypothetical protein [Pseudomonas sp. TH03]
MAYLLIEEVPACSGFASHQNIQPTYFGKTMNDLLQKRAALENELVTLEIEIPKLQLAWRKMPPTFNHLGNEIGSPESRAAMDAASSAEARARSIPQEIERIDIQIAYRKRVAGISSAADEARSIMVESAGAIKELEAKHLSLSKRLEDTRTCAEEALLKAQAAEQSAASIYTHAVVSENNEQEKTAMAEILKATKQLTNVQENDRRQQLVITALQSESDKTLNLISEAQKRYDDAKSQALETAYLALSVEWDEAIEHLVELGAKIIATRHHNGRSHDGLSAVKLPVLAPGATWPLNHKDLTGRANSISLTSLISA